MLNHYAFGESGRARGIDDIGQVARGEPDAVRIRVLTGALLPEAGICQIENGHRSAGAREQLEQVSLGQQRYRCGVLEHEAEPVSRVGRIERNISPAGLEHGKQSDDHGEATAPGTKRHDHPV